MDKISFPGLGIKEPFSIPKSFPFLFGREVAWYGVIICIGIILAITYAIFRAKRERVKTDDIIDLSFFLVIFGILGARLYYVIFEFDRYLVTSYDFLTNVKQTFLNAIAIWEGGLAIYGAIIAGFLTIVVFCRIKKIKLVKLLDIASPAVMIGQIIGRWGNFVNVEAYGSETNLPWRMGIHHTDVYIQYACEEISNWVTTYVHPTFLYESLWNLVGFIIANVLYRKKKFDGEIFCFYIAWYGFGRMFIEGLRTDSLMIGGVVRVSQLEGLLTFIVGTVLMILWAKRAKQERVALIDGSFAPVEIEESCEVEEIACEDRTEVTEDSSEVTDEKNDTKAEPEEK
jgi:phosphatidylglycerol:prolipoprotein diacylglycerol transferase